MILYNDFTYNANNVKQVKALSSSNQGATALFHWCLVPAQQMPVCALLLKLAQDLTCSWLTVELEFCFSLLQILRITFPFFDLESSTNCNFDFLQIHDGDTASAFIIGTYCGQNNPQELYSSHNSLYFWFRSDHTLNAGGFTVAWQSQDPGTCICKCLLISIALKFWLTDSVRAMSAHSHFKKPWKSMQLKFLHIK